MAGTIVSVRGEQWSAASWLFDWVLTTIANKITDAELSGELRGVVDENLGWLSLADFSGNQRTQILEALRSSVLPTAESELPEDLPHREEVVAHVRSLVAATFEDRHEE